MTKLELSGVRGIPLKLFSDYLTNRTQRVKIGEIVSTEEPVTYGVPQGSILGPSLFLIYINGLCNLSLDKGKVFTFADDSALLFNGDSWNDVFELAQKGVNRVCSWLKVNALTLNATKTTYMVFAQRSTFLPPTSLEIKIHKCNWTTVTNVDCTCAPLLRTDTTKYLGVIIDRTLSFKNHISALVKRLRKLMYIFKTLRNVANRNVIKMVYLALCQPIFGYCITAWGGSGKTQLLELERAQRAVLKVGAGLPFRFPTTDLYTTWDVLTVRQYFLLQTVLLKHSQINYDQEIVKDRRRKGKVCSSLNFRTKQPNRFFIFLGSYIYNLVNAKLSIYSLPRAKCKTAVTNWLKSLTYTESENLLIPLS